MNKIEVPLGEAGEIKRSLYRERITTKDFLEEKVRKLSAYESGERESIGLSDQERREVLEFERNIGEKLESIFDVNVRNIMLYAEYFLTQEGKEDFQKIIGKDMNTGTIEEVEVFLYSCRDEIVGLKDKIRSGLIKRSREYSEDKLKSDLMKLMDENGEIEMGEVEPPHNVRLILDNDNLLEKILRLRNFKEDIKEYRKDIPEEKTNEYRYVYEGILKMYQSRVNLMLVENLRIASAIQTKKLLGGDDMLNNSEKEILMEMPALERLERNLSRLDKFVHGASREYNSDGEREQISGELKKFVEKYEDEYVKSVLMEEEQIKEKGLDIKKLGDKSIEVDEKSKNANNILNKYNILSSVPQEEYEKSRSGPAEDDKWQFVVRENFTTNSVQEEKKIVKSPDENCSVIDLVTIIIGHEIEGHALQHENKSRLPLKIFDRIGSGRSDVFAECGAMQNQDFISQKAFGCQSLPKPHYIKTMLKKINGGSYIDCVGTYYDSSMVPIKLRKKLGKISEKDFNKESEDMLKKAIKVTKRLFRDFKFDSPGSGALISSKDTAYVEQLILFDKLKKYGLEKYVYFSGVNLDSLIFMKKSGLLKDVDILEPKFYALEVWDKIKDKYKLDE